MKFSWGFNFTDFGFLEFRGNKFPGIWIADFTPGNKVLWISCTALESNKKGSHMAISLFTVIF